MAKKPTKERRKANFLNDVFITGTLRFPKLSTPDEYEGKVFYSSNVIVDAAELARVKKQLTDFGHKAFPGEELFLPFKKDKKDPTITYVEVKWKRTDESGELKRPVIVDSRRKNIPRSVEVGGGTKVRLKATAMDYEATKLTGNLPGVTLLPESLQIIKLVAGRDPLAGLTDVEDGYVAGEEHGDVGEEPKGTESGAAFDL
jgi:hypothetical protein